ncbi:hypothetical protein J2799_002283 [Chryseobacterium vietnamense]|nr:hypothetical protein [Chryseobacterium vietnamense]
MMKKIYLEKSKQNIVESFSMTNIVYIFQAENITQYRNRRMNTFYKNQTAPEDKSNIIYITKYFILYI